jgi:hypothetical protein
VVNPLCGFCGCLGHRAEACPRIVCSACNAVGHYGHHCSREKIWVKKVVNHAVISNDAIVVPASKLIDSLPDLPLLDNPVLPFIGSSSFSSPLPPPLRFLPHCHPPPLRPHCLLQTPPPWRTTQSCPSVSCLVRFPLKPALQIVFRGAWWW